MLNPGVVDYASGFPIVRDECLSWPGVVKYQFHCAQVDKCDELKYFPGSIHEWRCCNNTCV